MNEDRQLSAVHQPNIVQAFIELHLTVMFILLHIYIIIVVMYVTDYYYSNIRLASSWCGTDSKAFLIPEHDN